MSTLSSRISSDANEFTRKRVLVTGGTKGAAKAIADRFRRGGATLIITARSAPEEKTENHFIQADVSTPEGTTKVIKQIRQVDLSALRHAKPHMRRRARREREAVVGGVRAYRVFHSDVVFLLDR